MKIIGLIASVVLLLLVGISIGKYTQGAKEDSYFPEHLRKDFFNNQPNCSTYHYFIKNNIEMQARLIVTESGEQVAVLNSLYQSKDEIRFIVSVISKKHEQFVDEVFLDCTG